MARAADLGLTEVAVHHRVTDMTAMVADSDVVLFLPRRLAEGKANVPLTVVESMAAGRPVVVTDLPQLAAVGEAARRVPAADHQAAARAVEDLLASQGTYDTAVTAGISLVRQAFSANVMCRSYAEIYDEILADTAAGAAG